MNNTTYSAEQKKRIAAELHKVNCFIEKEENMGEYNRPEDAQKLLDLYISIRTKLIGMLAD